jgi:E3 ubiquitin-protein ligase TRIP12
MCIVFTAPGYDDVELIEDGSLTDVTGENVQKFIELAVEKTILVTDQANAIRAGIKMILTQEQLAPFSESELNKLLCGTEGE